MLIDPFVPPKVDDETEQIMPETNPASATLVDIEQGLTPVAKE